MKVKGLHGGLIGSNLFSIEMRYDSGWTEINVCLIIEIDIDTKDAVCYSVKDNCRTPVAIDTDLVHYLVVNREKLLSNDPICNSDCYDVGMYSFTFCYNGISKRIFIEQPDIVKNDLYRKLYDFIDYYIEAKCFIEICSSCLEK